MSVEQQLEPQAALDFHRVQRALRFLEHNRKAQPDLRAVATEVGLSPTHLQRVFQRWAGVSPKRFLQSLTVHEARQLLDEGSSLQTTADRVGLSGTGRLHDLFVSVDAMTPGDYQRRGQGLTIEYGSCDSAFGECSVATTARGICAIDFGLSPEAALARIEACWPDATLVAGGAVVAQPVAAAITEHPKQSLGVLLRGTPFQLSVWKALMAIPEGSVHSYGDVAAHLGMPDAARAVGSAVARNQIAWLIPCHRVIRKLGGTGGYRWGETRKRAILGWEAAGLGRRRG